MKIRLVEIPGLKPSDQVACRIRALVVNDVSLALNGLAEWEQKEQADFKKILKGMRMLGAFGRKLNDETKVRKCSNPEHGDVYEIRAHKGKARLMFFYDSADSLVVICTNAYWKGKGSQDTAFKDCATFKDLYEVSNNEKDN